MDGRRTMRHASVIIFVAAIAVAVLFGGIFIAIGAFYAVCSAIMFFMSSERGQRMLQRAIGNEREQRDQRAQGVRPRQRSGTETAICCGSRQRTATPQRRALQKPHQHGPNCQCNLKDFRQGDVQPKGQ